MALHILYCEKCKEYTLHEECPKCSSRTVRPIPPKFSVEDKYEDLRRKAKEPLYKERGLI